MLPLRYQVQAAIGLEGVKGGVFKPPYGTPTSDYAALLTEVADAIAKLKALTPDEVNALENKDVVFNLAAIDAVCRQGLSADLLAGQLPFPRDDGLRHPSLEGRAARQARLSRPDQAEGVIAASAPWRSS